LGIWGLDVDLSPESLTSLAARSRRNVFETSQREIACSSYAVPYHMVE
jgi:hypothetical protein